MVDVAWYNSDCIISSKNLLVLTVGIRCKCSFELKRVWHKISPCRSSRCHMFDLIITRSQRINCPEGTSGHLEGFVLVQSLSETLDVSFFLSFS